jgi:hypothetical protein
VAVNLQRSVNGTTAMHLVNYDYDVTSDQTLAARDVKVDVRLPHPVQRVRLHAPGSDVREVAATVSGDSCHFTVDVLAGYVVAELMP